jgi:hypothetical protein
LRKKYVYQSNRRSPIRSDPPAPQSPLAMILKSVTRFCYHIEGLFMKLFITRGARESFKTSTRLLAAYAGLAARFKHRI